MKHLLRASALFAALLLIAAMAPPAAAAGPSGSSDPEAYTVSRIRLFVIHARQGATRVDAPMLRSGATEGIDQVVESTIQALDRVRRNSTFTDLTIVSQCEYLLQVVRGRGGGFGYQLRPEPLAEPYSSREYVGRLTAQSRDGQLALGVSVLRGETTLMQMEMLMESGRPIVVGLPQDDGSAIFAVLLNDGPEAPPTSMSDDPEQGRIHLTWDTPPRLVASATPVYPPIAHRAGVEGSVTLYVVVGIDGRVEEVEVVKADPRGIFDRAAEESVRSWRYRPAMVGGRPVRSRFSQTLQFRIDKPGSSWQLP